MFRTGTGNLIVITEENRMCRAVGRVLTEVEGRIIRILGRITPIARQVLYSRCNSATSPTIRTFVILTSTSLAIVANRAAVTNTHIIRTALTLNTRRSSPSIGVRRAAETGCSTGPIHGPVEFTIDRRIMTPCSVRANRSGQAHRSASDCRVIPVRTFRAGGHACARSDAAR
jgi:hypothetical protein